MQKGQYLTLIAQVAKWKWFRMTIEDIFPVAEVQTQHWTRCSPCLPLSSPPPVAPGCISFSTETGRESAPSRAAVWRSCGDQLGCVVWWQRCVKIESNQGSGVWSRFMRLPAAFSLYLSPLPPFFFPRSLLFYLTPTGLEVCATYLERGFCCFWQKPKIEACAPHHRSPSTSLQHSYVIAPLWHT